MLGFIFIGVVTVFVSVLAFLFYAVLTHSDPTHDGDQHNHGSAGR